MIRRVDDVAHRVAPTGHLFGVLRRAAPVAAAPAAKAAAAESAAAASPPTVAAAAVVAPSGTPIAVAVRLAIALIGVERPSSGDRRLVGRLRAALGRQPRADERDEGHEHSDGHHSAHRAHGPLLAAGAVRITRDYLDRCPRRERTDCESDGGVSREWGVGI